MKTIIVTGATGNMGRAVVTKFLTEGYRVIGAADPNDPTRLNIDNANFEKITVDLMIEEDTEKFVAEMISAHHDIDVVVATVGGFAMGNIAETKTSDIAKQYKLNFETAYNIVRPAFAHMLEKQRGRIFLVGSRPGLQAAAGKGMIAYGLAKSLLFRLA